MFQFEKDIHTALWGFEEWLVSAHPSAPGRILGGNGKTLRDIAPDFPLLVKKICARDRLSVQVHPNDQTAKTVGGEAKTEMWCVLEDGPIFAGLKSGVTAADVERATADGTFEDLLVRYDATRGECYFIPGGLVHAIGEGTSVYEVQQSSDTTFRLYDWGRVGADGKPRPLHVKSALAAMDLSLAPPVPSKSVSCAYFDFHAGAVASLPTDAWRIAFDPTTGASALYRPGEAADISPSAFVTVVKASAGRPADNQNA